jgi:peptidylprolyl isomerase
MRLRLTRPMPLPRTRPGRTLLIAACLASGAVALAACGSSTPSSTGGNNGQAAQTSTTTTTSAASGSSTTSTTSGAGASGSSIAPIPAADLSPAGVSGKAPTVVVPSGTPPTQLESADLIAGSGAVAKDGDSLTVQYVLATYSSKGVVQSSWTSQPFTFTLGQGQVIPGWDEGVVGMHVGGRRELIIPPSLGYGAQSPGPGIAANDTLVFVVDLLSIG